MFGGLETALDIEIYDNSGEYYSQAALYLNKKGRNKLTAIPYNLDSFVMFYKGNIATVIDEETDFAVTSVNHVEEIPSECRLEKMFGSEYESHVFVYACDLSNPN